MNRWLIPEESTDNACFNADLQRQTKTGIPPQLDVLCSSRTPAHPVPVKNVTDKDCSDVELLTVLLAKSGGTNCESTAADLLSRFENLRTLLHADDAELLACRGIGRARLRYLRVLPMLARRYFEASLPVGEAIRSPADTELFLKARMQHLDHEIFCCLYLDNRHRVLRFDEMFRGTIDGTSVSVYPQVSGELTDLVSFDSMYSLVAS